MATAPVGPQSVKPEWDMKEVKAPVQFQFSKIGQIAEGILISIEPVTVKGKETLEYLFQAEGGGRFTMLDTADLHKKINPDHVGRNVEVTYQSDDASFQKPGQSAMKVFRVRASEQKAPGF
jgi:hypothetical protein